MKRTYELCGKEDKNLYMHHVRKLTLLKGEVEWEKTNVAEEEKNSCCMRVMFTENPKL